MSTNEQVFEKLNKIFRKFLKDHGYDKNSFSYMEKMARFMKANYDFLTEVNPDWPDLDELHQKFFDCAPELKGAQMADTFSASKV